MTKTITRKAPVLKKLSLRDLTHEMEQVASEIEAQLDSGPIRISQLSASEDHELLEDRIEKIWERFTTICYDATSYLRGNGSSSQGLYHPSDLPGDPLRLATAQPEAKALVRARALRVATRENLDPDVRCAAISVALAAIVAPEELYLHVFESRIQRGTAA